MIFVYNYKGERVEPKDDDIHMAAFIPGEQDDVALCRAPSKKEAIEKFKFYFSNVSENNVSEINDLYWIDEGKMCLLTTY